MNFGTGIPKGRIWFRALGWMFGWGCGGGGQYQVSVVFPDEESMQLTRRVEVFAIEGGGTACPVCQDCHGLGDCEAVPYGFEDVGCSGYNVCCSGYGICFNPCQY